VKNSNQKLDKLEIDFLYETLNQLKFFRRLKVNCRKKKRVEFFMDLIKIMEFETFKRGEAIITYGTLFQRLK